MAENQSGLRLRAERAEATLDRVRAVVDPPCTCPGACSGPPRKVRADDIRAALADGARCPGCGGNMRFCECMDDPFAPIPCEHEWLDRPESDTRECLVCGTEVAG